MKFVHASDSGFRVPTRWGIGALAGMLVAGSVARGAPVFFEDAVAPIFRERCAECHGTEARKGELDLTSAAGVLRGGESGPVVEGGDSEHSHLLELVRRGEMPKKGDPLAQAEIDAIARWIEGGAQFRETPAAPAVNLTQHDVIPIMLLRCTACHGPQRRDGGLDLRTPDGMRKGGASGPALVPGDPGASLLIQRIESEACPPQSLLLKYFVKRPPSAEVAVLRDWIAAGAPEADIEPDVATSEPDPLVTDEDREHWSFVAPRRTSNVQRSTSNAQVPGVDAFVGAKLEEAGLDFSPEADRDTLIRRAWMDLVGMPPGLEQLRYWRGREDDAWFSEMVDTLLDSPHYGERWGRYWLDLAGYADSEGGVSADPVREVAWKYRDYVIDSFNEDKPYDRFLLEQIAGDELIDHANAEVVTGEMVENLVATGFLRMGIDQTGSRTMNFVPERLGVIGDAIDVLGSGVMGLTLECVRCHSHKYDPIPLRDYYRLKAVFQGAFDEHDWLSFKTRALEVGTPDHLEAIARTNPPIEKEVRRLEALRDKAEKELKLSLLAHHHPELTEQDRADALVALRKADNQRSLRQAMLVEKYRVADLLPDARQPGDVLAARAEIAELGLEIERTRAKLVPPATIRALWDRGDPSPTYQLRRGEHDKPGRLVGPGVPAVLTDGRTPFEYGPPFPGGTPKTGRRLAFAKWLAQPDHPLTARVMVNRIWHHHFGRGIVTTLENFGTQGAPPTHPELLDWLAVEFVERGWSIKEMHRIILNSRTWRQSSRVNEKHREVDPDNRLFSRANLRRMDAETVRDSLLSVSGRLDETRGGPPDGVTVDRDGLVSVNSTPAGDWRRSIYSRYRRTEIPTMMETFDYPEMGPNCFERSISTVSPQALMLWNNGRVRELSASLARRVEEIVPAASGDRGGALVETVSLLALGRPPTGEERRIGIESLREFERRWKGDPGRALETYCHAVLNSAAFVYID